MPYAIVVANPMHHTKVADGIPSRKEAEKRLVAARKKYGHDGVYTKVEVVKYSENMTTAQAALKAGVISYADPMDEIRELKW